MCADLFSSKVSGLKNTGTNWVWEHAQETGMWKVREASENGCVKIRTREQGVTNLVIFRTLYRDRLNSFSVLLSMTQAAPGRNARNLGKGI